MQPFRLRDVRTQFVGHEGSLPVRKMLADSTMEAFTCSTMEGESTGEGDASIAQGILGLVAGASCVAVTGCGEECQAYEYLMNLLGMS